ncbi:MAG: hypothetical protein ACETWR_06320 [Anaerolineae bacterium]
MNVDPISIALALVSLVGAWLIARKYGDVAAAKATREYQEELAKKTRVAALQSLRNEVVRIRELTKYHIEPLGQSVPEMPVVAFERAFVSGRAGVAAGEELVKVVSEYLVRADLVNSLIEMYLHSLNKGIRMGDIRGACGPLPEILDRLDDCLQRELGAL